MKQYNIQINHIEDLMIVTEPNNRGQIRLSFTPLLNALKECGYDIKNPPPKFLQEVKEWLLANWGDCISDHTRTGISAIKLSRKMKLEIFGDGSSLLRIWDEDTQPIFLGNITSFGDFINALKLTQST